MTFRQGDVLVALVRARPEVRGILGRGAIKMVVIDCVASKEGIRRGKVVIQADLPETLASCAGARVSVLGRLASNGTKRVWRRLIGHRIQRSEGRYAGVHRYRPGEFRTFCHRNKRSPWDAATWGRDIERFRDAQVLPQSFVDYKQKSLVFLDRPAERSPEVVSLKLRGRRIRKIEEILGIQSGVAHEIENIAVELVRSTRAHHHHLAAHRQTILSLEVGGDDFIFLDPLDAQGGIALGTGVAAKLILQDGPVKSEIVRPVRSAVDAEGGTESAATPRGAVSNVFVFRDAWLQQAQVHVVPSVQWQVLDGGFRHQAAESGVLGVYNRGIPAHRHLLLGVSNFESDVNHRLLRYFEGNPGVCRFLETRMLRSYFVMPYWQFQNAEIPGFTRGRGPHRARINIGDGHMRIRDGSARTITHDAQNRSGR